MIRFSVQRSAKDRQWPFDDFSRPFFRIGTEHPDIGVLLIHGFLGTAANMRTVGDAFAAAGYTVFIPLLRGHGTTLEDMNSCSGEDWLQDVLDGYDRLRAAGCQQIFLIGLSMGAILSSLAVTQRDAAGLILLSAPFHMKAYLYACMPLRFFFPYVVFAPKDSHFKKMPYEQLYDGCAVAKLKTLDGLCKSACKNLPAITCPTLIVQSHMDNKVHPNTMDYVLSRMQAQDVSSLWLEHSRHSCTYGDEQDLVADTCVRFVKTHSGSMPS